MKSIKCRVCGKTAEYVFDAEIMNGKHKVKYYFCANCGLTQVEEPFWLEEAYASPMNLTDVGVLRRNIRYSRIISVMLLFMFGREYKYLDYSGGYGIFTRLMRDLGFDFYWNDPYTQNLLARGFEYKEGMKIKALTSFEVFEHMVDVTGDMSKMVAISGNIFFSTQVTPDPLPKPKDWWYFGLEHGQHTSLYRVKTFQYLADKHKLQLYSNDADLHMFVQDQFAPQFIPVPLYLSFLRRLDRGDRQTLRSAYTRYKSPKLAKGGLLGVVQRQYYRRKYGEFMMLKSSVKETDAKQIHQILVQNKLMSEFVHYLFASAESIYNLFCDETWDYIVKDMNAMKKLIHKH